MDVAIRLVLKEYRKGLHMGCKGNSIIIQDTMLGVDRSISKNTTTRKIACDRTAILEQTLIAINLVTDEKNWSLPCFWPIVLSL